MAQDRGEIVEVMVVVKYPDNSVKVGRLDASKVSALLVDPARCERALPAEEWNSPQGWEYNPTCAVELRDGRVFSYCQTTGHETPPVWVVY